MASTQLTIDSSSATNILNSRQTLTTAHIGKQVMLTITGNSTGPAGTFVPKDLSKNIQFDKYIYNVKANSQHSMHRAENKAILTAAFKAEAVGDTELASKLFNDYLNAVQISFNVIADRAQRFSSGDMITAVVAEATSKKGQKQLVLDNPRYKAPEAVAKIRFNLTELMTESAPADDAANQSADTKAADAPFAASTVLS